jgi:hypothetical protein
MKKTLASLILASTVAGFASSAEARLSPTRSSTPQTGTSVHTGAVTGLCELKVTDGTLPSSTALLSPTITSALLGKIETKCNTATAQLVVDLDTHYYGTDDPGVQTITRSFQLTAPVGAYNAAYTGGGVIGSYQNAAQTFATLNHGYSTTASTLKVGAKIDAPSLQNLAAGGYTVRVKATLTP